MRRSFVVTAIVGIGVSCLAFNPIQQTQNTLSSGLVAAYSFSEGTGSSTADVSGNKNNFYAYVNDLERFWSHRL